MNPQVFGVLAATACAVAVAFPTGCEQSTGAAEHARHNINALELLVELDGLVCVQSHGLAVYAPTDELAQEMFFVLHGAVLSFEHTFGNTPLPVAFIVNSADLPAHDRELRDAGCRVVLGFDDWRPRFTDRGKGTPFDRLHEIMIEMYLELPVIRAYVDECGDSQGCVDEVRELISDSVSERTEATFATIAAPAGPDQFLPHELGHLLFIERYWPGAWHEPVRRYGGPSRDWLDEASAVLLEPPLLTSIRRTNAFEAFKGAELPSDFVPLEEFFTMTHPGFDVDDPPLVAPDEEQITRVEFALGDIALKVEGEDAVVIRHVRFDENGDLVEAGGVEPEATSVSDIDWFYTQCRSLIDFIESRAASETVWRSIAEHAAAGGEMPDWLAAHGTTHGLPPTVPELEAAWLAWASTRYR
ncbi:MAG: hypothetical protein AAGJ54_11495 [Planctomycetota bacterium]